MLIKFVDPALQDLEELRLYLTERSPSGYSNVITEIQTTVRSLPNSLSKGRATPRDDVWEKITPRYKFIIPYHVRGDIIYVLRVYRSNRQSLNYSDLHIPK
jgi:toxin ParE1/3/4